MRGYFEQPSATATAAVVSDGWYHTGDAGELDCDGYLYIRDRIKDMIISGGENVYSAEVENALHTHPSIAAVVGVPDPRFGEAITAFVVIPESHKLDAELVRRHVRERLAGLRSRSAWCLFLRCRGTRLARSLRIDFAPRRTRWRVLLALDGSTYREPPTLTEVVAAEITLIARILARVSITAPPPS
jgi:acyl-CoA synthetase (AMP-forming)/AMP-acid ligase II